MAKKKAVSGKKKRTATKIASPKTRFRLKSDSELLDLRALSAQASDQRAEIGACWFSDSGGADQCVQLPEDVCKSRGGVWTPGPCPN